MKFNSKYLAIVIVVLLCLGACTKIDYIGEEYPPTTQVDLFFDMEHVTREHKVMGHLIATAGYIKGDPNDFDADRCIDPDTFIAFVKETQPKEWAYLENLQDKKAEETLLDDLYRALNSEHEGCLSVLRHGFKCFHE